MTQQAPPFPLPQDYPSQLPEIAPSGFWSGEKLLAIQKSGIPLIEPTLFNERQIDCNCYTLLMGDQYFVTSIKGDSEPPIIMSLKEGDMFHIPAGQFAFLITKEQVFIPHYAMGFISMRTPFKFQGLINVSGFNVDPGFRGRLIFAVYNASPSPIPIRGGEKLFKIWFASLDHTSGKQYVFDKPPITEIDKNLIRGMNRELLSLQQLSEKIREVEKSLNLKIEGFSLKVGLLYIVWQGAILAVVILFLGAIVKLAFPGLWDIIDPRVRPQAQTSIPSVQQQTPQLQIPVLPPSPQPTPTAPPSSPTPTPPNL
jgi:dCTP deaminase